MKFYTLGQLRKFVDYLSDSGLDHLPILVLFENTDSYVIDRVLNVHVGKYDGFGKTDDAITITNTTKPINEIIHSKNFFVHEYNDDD